MKTLSERLKNALNENNQTQTDLARACGISQASVNHWLSGKSMSLMARNAVRAAEFLDVSLVWLTEGIGPMRQTGNLPATIRPLPPRHDASTEEVLKLMLASDETGRAMVLGAVKGALSGYVPKAKRNRAG